MNSSGGFATDKKPRQENKRRRGKDVGEDYADGIIPVKGLPIQENEKLCIVVKSHQSNNNIVKDNASLDTI